MTKLTNLYTTQKTITFDLKAQSTKDEFEFSKSQKWLESHFLSNQAKFDERIIEVFLDLSHSFRQNWNSLVDILDKSKNSIEVRKEFIEFTNRNKYFLLKGKTIKVEQENPETGNVYLVDSKMSDWNSLFVVDKLFGDNLYEVEQKILELLTKVANYENKTRRDFEFSNNPINQHLFSGKVNYYNNIRAWVENLQVLIKISSYFQYSPKNKNNITVFESVLATKNIFDEKMSELQSLLNFANNNTKQELELTTLNYKAVNKDPDKIADEEEELSKLESEIQTLDAELAYINTQKREFVEKLDYALTRNLPVLNLLNTESEDGKYCNELYQATARGERLTDEENKWIREMKFQKTILKYLKFKGVLIDKNKNHKNGKVIIVNGSKYECLWNYRQSGERLNPKIEKNLTRIEKLPEYSKFETQHKQYKTLLKDKFDKSIERGDKKSLYNSLFREISRQKMCNHFAMICRDSDVLNPFYYLVLIPNRDKDDMRQTYSEVKNDGEGWQFFNIQRLTFKALEKLALLDSSSFNQDFKELGNIKQILGNYKKKSYKAYKLSREEKQKVDYNNQRNYVTKMEKEELQKLIKYCNNCIQKLIKKEGYKFVFDFNKQFDDFDDYKTYIDQQCYTKTWVNIDFENIKKLENQGDIRIFKIHNKDFRKGKKPEQKDNLFTKYWLDAMLENNQLVRILPEIDIFKRPKEEQKAEKTRKLKTSNKEIVDKARIYKDKLQGAFRLEFYPANKIETLENINYKIKTEFSDKTYYLGIDRGENELASFCLIDSKGQLIKNGCWNGQNKIDKDGKVTNSADKVKAFYYSNTKQGKVSLFEQKNIAQEAISAENNPEQKQLRINEFRVLEEKLAEANQLATDFVKNSYCAYLIGEINKILVEYPNTYIVLEDLNIADKDKNTGDTNREQTIEKTLGATVYQVIENAIVNKFKYYVVKTGEFQGDQLVPNITKVEDLRVKNEIKSEENKFGKTKYLKSKDQVGNILFVDEDLTSNECPNCNFNMKKFQLNSKIFEIEEMDDQLKFSINGESYIFPANYYKIEKIKDLLTKHNTDPNSIQNEFFVLFKPRIKSNGFYGIGNELNGTKDIFCCSKCGFSTTNCNSNELKSDEFIIKSGDDVASYNIAKKGLGFVTK
jgi:hypothetical protein